MITICWIKQGCCWQCFFINMQIRVTRLTLLLNRPAVRIQCNPTQPVTVNFLFSTSPGHSSRCYEVFYQFIQLTGHQMGTMNISLFGLFCWICLSNNCSRSDEKDRDNSAAHTAQMVGNSLSQSIWLQMKLSWISHSTRLQVIAEDLNTPGRTCARNKTFEYIRTPKRRWVEGLGRAGPTSR